MIFRARFRDAVKPVQATATASAEARMLAMSYVLEEAVESGGCRSVAEIAYALGVTRARLSQVMRTRWLKTLDQERILLSGVADP